MKIQGFLGLPRFPVTCLRYARPAEARPEARGQIPLNVGLLELKASGSFEDFLGDHFTRVESSGDQNPIMFISHVQYFHCFPMRFLNG